MKLDRREFLAIAAALGASAAWAGDLLTAPSLKLRERRDLFPQGVASGDPDHHSVLLWTRYPASAGSPQFLLAEIATDADFRDVVATATSMVSQDADWTCRVLVGGLRPRRVYWYRFIDAAGNASRVGRTITAPAPGDALPVSFAFVSCQSVNEGAQNAYRRMIWEDQHASGHKIGFVLHLGDFIYEVVEYPDEISHRYDRVVYDIGKVPDGRKVGNFHVPTTLDGYRMVYRAHIDDPDVQDARAWFPFVCIGDNHEFSWQGWQSFIKLGANTEPAQQLRVAANQAWWEFIPARVRKASGENLVRFDPPAVVNTPVSAFASDGFGDEPNNREAVNSMIAYRAMLYGRHVELIMTDFHSFAMEDPTGRSEADPLNDPDFPYLFAQEALEVLDAGRSYDEGRPPNSIKFGAADVTNFRKTQPPITLLGSVQKAWLKERLRTSSATWKIWAATNGTLDMRTDPHNLPLGLAKKPWPGAGFATFGGGDFSAALTERAEIYDTVHEGKVTGFTIVSGDRHSFWAGYAAKSLPPEAFNPVGISFITGSISAAGLSEALEHGLKDHPLRPIYVATRADGTQEPTINLALKHGVKTALEYARTFNLLRAHTLSNPDVAPHVEFVDMAGHGYSVVTAGPDRLETEFVCVPRPIRRSGSPDGGPIRYRVQHRAKLWSAGERPRLEQRIVDGDVGLSV